MVRPKKKKKEKKIPSLSLIISKTFLNLEDNDYRSTIMSRGVRQTDIGIPVWYLTTVSLSLFIPDTYPSQIDVKVKLDDSLHKGLSIVPGTTANTQ